jgi:uncharacterized protein (TIGR00255 family)
VSVSSMTGFARAEGTKNGYSWSWEIRSVNARSLDARLRLPPGMERLEVRLKPDVASKFQRGNVSATLSLDIPSIPMYWNRCLISPRTLPAV